MTDDVKHLIDLGSLAATIAALVDAAPKIAAVLSAFWVGARLYNEVMTAIYRRRADRRKR